MRVALILAALLLPAAAQARGIDCKKAATALEKTICADKEMLEADEQIAGLYARHLTAWNGAIAAYVRRDQATWLARFRQIGKDEMSCELTDKPCIRDEMRRRVADLDSGTYANSGVYIAADGRKLLLSPKAGNAYGLRVFDPKRLPDHVRTPDEDGAAMWDGPNAMVAKMGDSNGLPLPAGDGCTLRMTPAALAMTVVQKGKCAGRNYAGSYARKLDQTLAEYEFSID